MDPAATPIPRLRISRNSIPNVYNSLSTTAGSTAGPSRLPDISIETDDDDQQQDNDHHNAQNATPKLLFSSTRGSGSMGDKSIADRLREIIQAEHTPSQSKPEPPPATTSEHESDFETPRFSASTRGMAHASLKSIFSHAIREPGNTPKKGKARRNSLESSEAENIPRVSKQEKLRSQRKSVSDEESTHQGGIILNIPPFPRTDQCTDTYQRSETSQVSSQAATFDSLRARLEPRTPIMSQGPPTHIFSRRSPNPCPGGVIISNQNLQLRPTVRWIISSYFLNLTPPNPLPLLPLALRSNLSACQQRQIFSSLVGAYHSNHFQTHLSEDLLDHDSDMQHAMSNMDSYEGMYISQPMHIILILLVTNHDPSTSSRTLKGKQRADDGPSVASSSVDNISRERSKTSAQNRTSNGNATQSHAHRVVSPPHRAPRSRTSSGASLHSVDEDSSSREGSLTSYTNCEIALFFSLLSLISCRSRTCSRDGKGTTT